MNSFLLEQLLFLGSSVVFAIFLVFLIFYGIKLLLYLRECHKAQYVLLELTPPSQTSKTAYSTVQLFKYLHALVSQQSIVFKLFGNYPCISLEIVSTHEAGIRYLVRVKKSLAQSVQNAMRSYLPYAKVSEVSDYLDRRSSNINVIEFSLSKHFAYPLKDQSTLEEHDPLSYITGMMTKLGSTEQIALQYVISPNIDSQPSAILKNIVHGMPLPEIISKYSQPVLWFFAPFIWCVKTLFSDIFNSNTNHQTYIKSIDQPSISQFEKELQSSIKFKLEQPLFNAVIRCMIKTKDTRISQSRSQGIISSFGIYASSYQSLETKKALINKILPSFKALGFYYRLPSFTGRNNNRLSVSEISDLYHFPYSGTNLVENVAKVHSKKLPPTISLKQTATFDNVFAQNNYGGSMTPIGLNLPERARHMYVIGATGSGKSTLMHKMITQDIQNGKSVFVVDPHGDLALSLLDCIPEHRISDVVYFNPFDIAYPIGINLLEIESNLSSDDRMLEQEFVTESVVSLFRKVFSEGSSGHPHRIEYILRNTIHTAFTIDNPTIFTIFNLLNDPSLQKEVVSKLQDENLLNFWKYEFGKAGDYQKVKMVSPVTARIGRFLFSPSAKRVLEQERSTINFEQILNENKIVICNLSKGNLGEDTSEVMGVLLLNKLQLALLKRARTQLEARKPIFLYVDEFQNFATPSFVQMLSESRKYGLHLTIAEQSTSQQDDRQMVNTILANVGNVVSFRTANPQDEDLLLRQFSPYISKGDLPNLPAFNFYMKTSGIEPQEPFSGETIVSEFKVDHIKRNLIIESSRVKYALKYVDQSISNSNTRSKSKKLKKDPTKPQDIATSVFPEGF